MTETATQTTLTTVVCNSLSVAVRYYARIAEIRKKLHANKQETFDRATRSDTYASNVDVGGRRYILEGEYLHTTIHPGGMIPSSGEVLIEYFTLVSNINVKHALRTGVYERNGARAELISLSGIVTPKREYKLTMVASTFDALCKMYEDIMAQSIIPEKEFDKPLPTKADLEKTHGRVLELEAELGMMRQSCLSVERERDNAVKAAAVWRAFAEACVRCNNSIRASGLFCGLVTSSWHIRDRKKYLAEFLKAVTNYAWCLIPIPESVAKEVNQKLPFLDGTFNRD